MSLVFKGKKDKYTFTDVVEMEGQQAIILDITDLEAVRRIVNTTLLVRRIRWECPLVFMD